MTDRGGPSIRQTKIVATIGPASLAHVPELAAAGMDVARVNLSHGTPAWHRRASTTVRAAQDAVGRPIGLLVDLAGPKLRLGELQGGEVELRPGGRFGMHPGARRRGTVDGAAVSDARLGVALRPGDRVLLADGAVELRVTATGRTVETEVVRGGNVRSRAGVAIPAERLPGPALTDADRAALTRLPALDADLVAQSFVRGASDVAELRAALGPDGPRVVAKIETRPAVEAFDDILAVADAVMIARGDLGVELPYEEVPLVQKRLVQRALDRGVPAIVATQMLESMTAAPRPTRAEASDVATAVLDGADAILLSGETAIGAFPQLACEAADRIALATERRGADLLARAGDPPLPDPDTAVAVAAASLVAADAGVRAIACVTRTGHTARVLSARRPGVPIVAFVPDPRVARALGIVHGVVSRVVRAAPGAEEADGDGDHLGRLAALVDASGLVPSGSGVVLVASSGAPGAAPDRLALHRTGS